MPDSASRATVRGEQSWLRRPIPIGHNIKNKRKKIQLEMGRNAERGDTMTTQHPTASRTRLPSLIAAWLFIIAATITMSSGLPGAVQAEAERGAIPWPGDGLTLHSTEPGQLVITSGARQETPDPAPTDYRIRWANTDLGWPSWSGTNETERANEYPLGGVTSLTLNNLTPGDSYKVQMRSRYYNADRSVHESSGPWTNTATQRVKNNPPAAPTGLIAARIGHSVLTLTWDDPQDDTITGYRILRGAEADNLAVINSDTANNATEYEDDTVKRLLPSQRRRRPTTTRSWPGAPTAKLRRGSVRHHQRHHPRSSQV